MTIGQALHAVLTANAAVFDMVGTRIFPNVIPQGEALPAIRYQVISDVEEATLEPVEFPLSNARVQVDCYGKTNLSAQAVADAVNEVLRRHNSPDLAFWRIRKGDTFDPEARLHCCSADFSCWS